MSAKARDWARGIRGITASEAIVLRELAEYHNETKGEAWPSIETLQEGCHGINEKTIRRALASLDITHNLINRTQRGTRHQPSKYAFNFQPDIAEKADGPPGASSKVNYVQPDNPSPSTGHPVPVNRTSTASQPDIYGQQQEKEPLRTISKPLLKPVVSEFVNRTIKAWEQNIGIVPRAVVDLIQAIADGDGPPAHWGEDAIQEAVKAGVRNWNYISAILNRWIQQGTQDDRREARNGQQRGSVQTSGVDVLRRISGDQTPAAGR